MTKIIRWTNKYSNEQGYVMTAKKADGHFVSTTDASLAKTFARQCDVVRTLNLLADMSDAEDNLYEAIEL